MSFRWFSLQLILFLNLVSIYSTTAYIQPVLDIDDESAGYFGTLDEQDILVDLKPHLRIKNTNETSKLESVTFTGTPSQFLININLTRWNMRIPRVHIKRL